MPPYKEDYRVGSAVQIKDLAALETFRAKWHHHHPLSPELLEFAGRQGRVETVGFYHGGDPIYTLVGIPGTWHEVCLTASPDASAV
jgi:hypothetical protein